MKLYIKQQIFSWNDRFSVLDEDGLVRYTVEGELFSWGKKLHVYDKYGQEAAFIKQEVFSWMPRYYVYIQDRQVAEIVREFTFFLPRYRVDGPDWIIDGGFMAHDYAITKDTETIASIGKEWMTWGDSYEIHIQDPKNELIALAAVLTIDCVLATNND